MVSAVQNRLLGCVDCYWGFGGDELGKFVGFREELVVGFVDSWDEASVEGFVRSEESGSVCQFSCPAFATNYFLKALNCPQISANSNISLLDGKLGSFGAESYIASGRYVDPSSYAIPLNSTNDRNSARLHAVGKPLQRQNMLLYLQRLPSCVRLITFLIFWKACRIHCWVEIQASCEVFALCLQYHNSSLTRAQWVHNIQYKVFHFLQESEADSVKFSWVVERECYYFTIGWYFSFDEFVLGRHYFIIKFY